MLALLLLCTPGFGDATIRAPYGGSEIVIQTTARLAGAIHSLTWKGQEFTDSADHGRQLQSAASFDLARPGEFWAECFNPTEAGSRDDGAGPTSSSKLLKLRAKGSELWTTTQMAFWLAPSEASSGRPALNDRILSQHQVSKHVKIGVRNHPNVIDYRVTFRVPKGETHHYAQFEALTGYMPPAFRNFWTFDSKTSTLKPLDDGPGEQALPVVFSTDGGTHAMGIYSPDQPSKGFTGAGYGRFRFTAERVVKWNCVFRERSETAIRPGDYRYQMFVVVGTLADVTRGMAELSTIKSSR